MIKPSIALDFADPSKVPLVLQFEQVLLAPYKGIQEGSRAATVKFFDEQIIHGPELSFDHHEGAEEKAFSSLVSTVFKDGSIFGTQMTTFADGSLGFSCSFVGETKEALVALIDAASAALTEMDAKVLSEGLHNS